MSSFIYNRKERFFKFLVLSVSFDGLRFWPTFLVKGSNSALHKKRTKRFFKNPLFVFEDNTLLFILLQTVSSYHERRSRGFVLKLHGNKEGKSRVGDGLNLKGVCFPLNVHLLLCFYIQSFSLTECIVIVRVRKTGVVCLSVCLSVCLCVCLSVTSRLPKLLGRFQPNLPKWVP